MLVAAVAEKPPASECHLGRIDSRSWTRGCISSVCRSASRLFVVGSFGQLGAIVLGALAGLVLCRVAPQAQSGHLAFPVSRRAGAVALVAFVLLLVVPQVLATGLQSQALALFDAFYCSGALVFGGGHVVLPLLQAEVVSPGWVNPGTFLAGYGAAQAAPGPLFTFAAYLGAVVGQHRTESRARPSRSWRASCRVCFWSTAACPTGMPSGRARSPRPPCGAPCCLSSPGCLRL